MVTPKLDFIRVRYLDGKYEMILIIEEGHTKEHFGPVHSEGAFHKFADILRQKYPGVWDTKEKAINAMAEKHRLNKRREHNDAGQPYPKQIYSKRPILVRAGRS